MRRTFIRAGVIAAVVLGSYAASNYTFPSGIPPVRAQAPDPALTAVPAATDSPVATATAVPTVAETETPDSPTVEISSSATSTAAASTTPQPTTTAAPSPSSTPTPISTSEAPPDLPPVADAVSTPGTERATSVGPEGGLAVGADGRIALSFQPGTVDTPIVANIKVVSPDGLPVMSTHPFIEVWELSARTGGGEDVGSSFAAAVTAYLRITGQEFPGMNPRSLRLWTFDATARLWSPVEGQSWSSNGVLVAPLQHFSFYGLSADLDIDMAPFSDVSSINMNAGSAQLSIPIELPSGRGGLTPQLSLNYDSGRVDGMRSHLALGSWVGTGWNLSGGSISADGADLFLNLGGTGGKLFSQGSGDYALESQDFRRIQLITTCADGERCKWEVTDKQGTEYFFGAETDSFDTSSPIRSRWDSRADRPLNYQWDLAKIVDVSGNVIDFTYHQLIKFEPGPYVPPWTIMDSYLTAVSWNGGAYSAEFDVGPDSEYENTGLSNWPLIRQDDPRDINAAGCSSPGYVAPSVMELRRLKSLRVKVAGNLLRQYDFAYTTTPFTYGVSACNTVNESAGRMTLTSMTERGRSGGALRTHGFTYGSDATVHFAPDASTSDDSHWPLLTRWDNGFGGSVTFSYLYVTHPSNQAWTNFDSCWSANVVSQRSVDGGLGQPAVTHGFTYADGPDGESLGSSQCSTYFGLPVQQRYLGFARVFDTDAVDDQSEHGFYTARAAGDYERAGHEYESWVRGPATGGLRETWSHTLNTWVATGAGSVHFVHLDRSDTYLRDGTPLDDTDNPYTRTEYTYDSYGDTTEVKSEGVSGTDDDTTTSTPYIANIDKWIFVPKYGRVSDASDVELRRTNFYYDGLTTWDPAPTDVVAGRRTAVGTLLQPSQTSYAYSVYDTYGNVIKQSTPSYTTPQAGGSIPAGVPYNETTIDTVYHVLPTDTYNAIGQHTHTVFDNVMLKPTRTEEPNGHFTEIRYDQFGRPTKAWDNLDSETLPTVTYTYVWAMPPSANSVQVNRRINPGASDQQEAIRCLDGFGREVARSSEVGAGVTGRVRTNYDARGMTASVTNPFLAEPFFHGISCATASELAAPIVAYDRTSYAYDPMGQQTQAVHLDANQTSGPYTETKAIGLRTESIDEDGHRVVQTRDLAARTLSVEEDTGNRTSGWQPYATTLYQYDRLAQLTGVTDAKGNQTQIAFDMAGRKTSMTDPDMGYWTYAYDPAGNLTTQTDARGRNTYLQYDALNRVTSRQSLDPIVLYVYDNYLGSYPCPNAASTPATAVGRMTAEVVGFGFGYNLPAHLPCYDTRGDAVTSRSLVDGIQYSVGRTFDGLGDVASVTYPDNEVLTYAHNAVTGALTGATSSLGATYLNAVTLTPWGAPQSMQLGGIPSDTTSYTFDSRMRTKTIKTGPASGTQLQSLSLTYDDASNVKTVTDNTVAETAAYTYDDLDRLTVMTVNGATAASYGYNAIDNMTSKTESLTGMLNPSSITLAYPAAGQPRPHAATSTSGTPGVALTYDADGNLATQGSATYTYNTQNLVTARSTASGTVSYQYYGDGQLAKRTNADGSWTVYVDGVYEKGFASGGASAGTTNYYQALGRNIAVRQVPAAGGSGTLSYLLQDHLGSTVGMLDASGALVATQRYWPYGATRATTGALATDKQYTGQQQESGDPALGLYNYKARFYSTVLGRFVSADTVPDGLNRYEYVHDNPLRYRDPSGTCVPDGHGGYLPCTREDMVRFFSCAWGGGCDAGDKTDAVRAYARGATQSDSFKYFVGLESAANGDIRLRLHLAGTVKGLARKFPSSVYPHDDSVGNFQMYVDVDATKRRVEAAYGWFTPSDGLGGYLDGWRTEREYYRAGPGAKGANLLTEAGPQGGSPLGNPFAESGFYARLTWDLWFEGDGALSQEIIFAQQGDVTRFIPIGNDIPYVDDLLTASGLSLTVTDIPELVY